MKEKRRGGLSRHGKWGYVVSVAAFLLVVSAGHVLAESPGEYVVIGWSDALTGFSNSDFSTFALFPPYSTLRAQVVKRGVGGAMPSLVTRNVRLTYEIPGNTYSAGKTNFWEYAESLFGVELEPDVGLTGRGMNGQFGLAPGRDHFEAEGIPATPYMDFDLGNEDPYQLAFVNVFSEEGDFLSHTEPVIAVSNEINCTACHLSDVSIITAHPNVPDFDMSKPILCAGCHASNVYGTQGIPRARSLSERIHQSHNDKTNNCQMCHPGPKTRPLRGGMSAQHGLICQDCHGNMAGVAESIGQGRRPWLDEPRCGTCHGDRYSEKPGKLFRDSRGHGGLYCSACHGSPHAILPSREPRENVQNIVLQGAPGTLRNCGVCHEQVPAGPGPHEIGK